jgi:hypothetical protein
MTDTSRRDDVIDEGVLRRALRLEHDERIPRFDAQAIAALAAQTRTAPPVAPIAIVASALMSAVAVVVWSALFDAAPAFIDAAVATALDGIVAFATLAISIAQVASQPAIPLSLLAALGVAILFELRERRERPHAHAS